MTILFELIARLRFLLFSLTMLAISSCNKTTEISENAETFSVIFPIVKDTVLTREYVADIQAVRNIEIRSRVRGFVETIHVDEGRYVNEGQLIFTISSHEHKQELLKAKAALNSLVAEARTAELELSSVNSLFDKKLVSESELKLSQAKLEVLKARVDEGNVHVSNAELQLSYTQIKAPFSGVINRIPNKVGSLIEDGSLLTSLSDNNEVFAYFNVTEKEYLDMASIDGIENKTEVMLALANDRMHRFKGFIETVEGEVDKSTGNIAFRARFPNPDKLVKHGSTGKVLVSTSIEQAILVPQKSTFEIQDNVYVYVVDGDNNVHLRSFQPKVRLPHFYIVESGLSAKDKIIYEGIQQVKDGDEVEIKLVQMDQILAALTGL